MPELSIGDAVTWWAGRDPDGVAVRRGEQVLTRADLDRRASALAGRWVADGLRVDDLVSVVLPTGVDLVVACVAAWKAGAVPQPLSPDLPPQERAALLALAAPVVLVDTPLVDLDPAAPPPPGLAAACWKASTSSGSTGRPRLVLSTSPARVDPLRPVAPYLPLRATQLVAGPLTHAAAFTYAMRGLMTGHTLVLPTTDDPGDPGEWLRLVAREQVTWGLLAPSTMARILRHPDRVATDVSSLEQVLHLGARCAPWLKRAWLDWLGPDRVVEVYAGTEAQGIAMITGREWQARPGSVGRGVSGSRFRVLAADGTELPPGRTGEIWMRREHETYAYRGCEPVVRDGWHTQGDRGRVDEEGWLWVGDRVADVIGTRAGPVDPADVEQVLEEHPAVGSAVAVGRPDHRRTGPEVVHAVVHAPGRGPAERATELAAELAAWVAERLPEPLRPRSWQWVDQPLRDGAGKVRRRDWRVPGTG